MGTGSLGLIIVIGEMSAELLQKASGEWGWLSPDPVIPRNQMGGSTPGQFQVAIDTGDAVRSGRPAGHDGLAAGTCLEQAGLSGVRWTQKFGQVAK